MRSPSRRSQGFTLVELLVVIAIIGILVAMLLPAVNAAREAARRAQCTNNIRNVGQSLHLHHEAYRTLPPGVPSCASDVSQSLGSGATCQGPNWLAAILPYVEEGKTMEVLTSCLDNVQNACLECPTLTEVAATATAPRQPGVGQATPPIFLCPSDISNSDEYYVTYNGLDRLSKANVAGNFGSQFYFNFNTDGSVVTGTNGSLDNGAFEITSLSKTYDSSNPNLTKGRWKLGSNQGVDFSAMRDGTSKTIMVSEVRHYRSKEDGRGAWFWSGMGGASFTAKNLPNARGTGASNPLDDKVEICGAPGSAQATEREKWQCVQGTGGQTYASARSAHPGGVVVSFGDGHTDFISENIDLVTWWALATRDGPASEPKIIGTN